MKQQPEKKKTLIMFPSVKEFMREQPGDVKKELNGMFSSLKEMERFLIPMRRRYRARICLPSASFRRETSGSFTSTDSKTGFMPFMDMSRKPRKYPSGKWPSREKR